MHAGIATHYCESVKLAELEQALINLENIDDIGNVFNKFCPKFDSVFSLAACFEQINRCFDASAVEDILNNLEGDESEWAKQTIKVITRSN